MEPFLSQNVSLAQQELLLDRMDPLNATNVEQDNMKSTELLVLLAQRGPPLWLDPQVKLHAMHAQQELLLDRMDPLNAIDAEQGNMKSTEPLVLLAQRVPLPSLDPQVKLHVTYAQQELLLDRMDPLNATNAEQEHTKSTEPLALLAQRVPLL